MRGPGRSRRARRAFLRACRSLGLFALSRRLCRGRLLVLCYHGVATQDEHRWNPRFFVSPETLGRRLDYLRRRGIPVVPLAEGLARVGEGSADPLAVAVTFDDGWRDFATRAAPALRARGMPALLYVTSYHLQRPDRPVFDVAVDYILWSAGGRVAPGSVIGQAEPLPTQPEAARRGSLERIYAHAESLDGAAKDRLARALADAVGVSYDTLVRERRLCLMSEEELRACGSLVAVGLHTHRHRVPDDPAGLVREIEDNRAALRAAGVTPEDHFCYPSGEWAPSMWPALLRSGVVSAATCEPGLVGPGTPRLALPRFLDGEDVSDVEFEAWVNGFMPLLRGWLGRRPTRTGTRREPATLTPAR